MNQTNPNHEEQLRQAVAEHNKKDPEAGAVTVDNANPQAIELRGYEIAHPHNGGWAQDMKFRPNKYGFEEACCELKRLCESYPNETYRIRPIVSFEPFQPPAEPAAEEPIVGQT